MRRAHAVSPCRYLPLPRDPRHATAAAHRTPAIGGSVPFDERSNTPRERAIDLLCDSTAGSSQCGVPHIDKVVVFCVLFDRGHQISRDVASLS
jgi:hypothetical protein